MNDLQASIELDYAELTTNCFYRTTDAWCEKFDRHCDKLKNDVREKEKI